jgi:hypothetical protein
MAGTISSTAPGAGRRTFAAVGFHRYVAALPAGASGELRIDFELDKSLNDPALGARELGVQVCFSRPEAGDGRRSDARLALY